MAAAAAQGGGGSTIVRVPVSVNATINAPNGLSDADKEALAYEFSEAIVRGAEITYTAHRAHS